jgi:hypothetical protein
MIKALHYIQIFLFFLFLTKSNSSFTQYENISSKILYKNCEFYSGESVSNILKVTNKDSSNTLNFKLSVAHPENWRYLGDKLRVYSLLPNDSVFLPVRIIPYGKIKGNTKYVISCYLYDVDNRVTISSNFFFVKKPRESKWTVNAEPSNLIYLKNDEFKTNFSFNIHNQGTEKEELMFKIIPNKIEKIIITDSLGKPKKKLKTLVTIAPGKDTSIHYTAALKGRVRNFQRVGLEEPDINNKKQRFHIFANTKQSIFFDTKLSMNSALEIRHLPNSIFVNPYSRPSAPLTINTMVSNLGSEFPVYNTLLNGLTILPNKAKLFYNSQIFLGGGSKFSLRNLFLNLSYTQNRLQLATGNVATMGGLSGKGIRGSYNLNKNFSFGGFLSFSPTIVNNNGISYGLNSLFKPSRKFSLSNSYIRSILESGQKTLNFFSGLTSLKITDNQTIGLGVNVMNTNSSNPLNQFNNTGFQINANYGINYLNKKAFTHIGTAIANGATGAVGAYSAGRLGIRHNTSYKLNKKWSFILGNNYVSRDSISSSFSQFSSFSNTLNINGEINGQTFSPSFFYNIITFNNSSALVKGLTYSFSDFDFVKNKRLSLVFTLGNKKPLIDSTIIGTTPFFIGNINYKYRVWQGLISYSRGSISPNDVLPTLSTYSLQRENLLFSISNQYQFKNPRFILNNNLSFRSNTRNSITINPQLYYFTKNNIRIYFNPGLFWNKNKRPANFSNEAPPILASYGTFVNFGIRKNIGIPLPKSKQLFISTKFLAFLDNNGNHTKDKDESYLENVVISFGENEVITNDIGEASINNVYRDSLYNLSIFSLEDLNGFFPYYFKTYLTHKDSTVNIPFVKGVKVYGEIYIDRDETNKKFDTKFDLSNLRVSAFNGVDVYTLTDSKGRFSLYVPYGEYEISIDENMLGNKFKCLENNFKITLDESTESVFVSFYLVEKRKKVTIKKF